MRLSGLVFLAISGFIVSGTLLGETLTPIQILEYGNARARGEKVENISVKALQDATTEALKADRAFTAHLIDAIDRWGFWKPMLHPKNSAGDIIPGTIGHSQWRDVRYYRGEKAVPSSKNEPGWGYSAPRSAEEVLGEPLFGRVASLYYVTPDSLSRGHLKWGAEYMQETHTLALDKHFQAILYALLENGADRPEFSDFVTRLRSDRRIQDYPKYNHGVGEVRTVTDAQDISVGRYALREAAEIKSKLVAATEGAANRLGLQKTRTGNQPNDSVVSPSKKEGFLASCLRVLRGL